MTWDDRLSLIRSVGLRRQPIVEAATCRFCPQPTNPTRWTSSLNWRDRVRTTNSIVRPPEGRARSGRYGHQLPPARIRPADRFRCRRDDIENQIDFRRRLPASLSRSTNPVRRSREPSDGRQAPVPMTYAPASRASWLAIEPTTPAAPCTRTLCPAVKAAG